MSVEPIGIESRGGAPDLDQPGRSLRLLGPASWMPENPPEFVGILNDSDNFHIPATIRQGLVVKDVGNGAVVMSGLPSLRRALRNIRVVPQV